nr:hypothetical protein [Candidatus Sigynarchaeota archaeon]
MNETDEYYDPSKIDGALRSQPDHVDEYLAKKGLKCVNVERGHIDGFQVGHYYVAGSESERSSMDNPNLPDFVKALHDDAVQFEFLGSNSAAVYPSEYAITRDKLDKEKFRKELPASVHNYRGLVDSMDKLPFSERQTIHVARNPPAAEDIPKSAETFQVGSVHVTGKEFKALIKKAMIEENRGIIDAVTLDVMFMGDMKDLDVKLIDGPDRLYEFRVQSVHKIDPTLFEAHCMVLKIQNVVFDLSEFLDWKSNVSRR